MIEVYANELLHKRKQEYGDGTTAHIEGYRASYTPEKREMGEPPFKDGYLELVFEKPDRVKLITVKLFQ